MKNQNQERLGRSARLFYRKNPPWVLSGGVYIPNLYSEKEKKRYSWWDDVGFILNGRRVMVWWRHPRDVYSGELETQAWKLVGTPPTHGSFLDHATANYRAAGQSRKKVISYTSAPISEEYEAFYQRLDDEQNRLSAEGIDFEVRPSYTVERLSWATGVELVAPIEVRSEADARELAALARRLLKREITLDLAFPSYVYQKGQWLEEKNGAGKTLSHEVRLK